MLVTGPGHAHNELLSWVLNQNTSVVNNFEFMWQLYPGPFGTFIRINDRWNTYKDYQWFANYYNSELRAGTGSQITEEQIIKLRDLVLELYAHSNHLSQYVNCLNVSESVKFASNNGIPSATAIIDLPNSKFRSHYVQMEFSIGAAESRDYSKMNFGLPEVCHWLVKKHRQQINDILPSSADAIVNINNILSDDIDVVEYEIRKAMHETDMIMEVGTLFREDTYENLQYFKFINQPVHALMQTINEMSWDDILEEAQKY